MTSAPPVSKSFNIRESSFEDYPQILALESAYDLQPKTYETWKNLWSNNPAFHQFQRRFGQQWPIGWVLTDGDRIVGSIGNIPMLYEFEGRTLFVAAGHAWVVDETYRSYSPFLLDLFFTQERVDLCLATSVNAQAAKVYEELRAIRVPKGEWDQSLFWITNYKGFTSSLLRSKNVPVAKLFSYPLSTLVWLKDRLARPHRNSVSSPISVTRCYEFGSEFDALWNSLRQRNLQHLFAVRDRETLNWHFKPALVAGRLWLFTVSAEGKLLAYAIFLHQDNPKYGLKRVRLVDFQSLSDSEKHLTVMLEAALKQCQVEKTHMLEILGFSPEQRDSIRELQPLQRQLPSWLYLYRTSDPVLAEKLKNPQVWSPCVFDGDLSL